MEQLKKSGVVDILPMYTTGLFSDFQLHVIAHKNAIESYDMQLK